MSAPENGSQCQDLRPAAFIPKLTHNFSQRPAQDRSVLGKGRRRLHAIARIKNHAPMMMPERSTLALVREVDRGTGRFVPGEFMFSFLS
jgi:hypothetical protein